MAAQRCVQICQSSPAHSQPVANSHHVPASCFLTPLGSRSGRALGPHYLRAPPAPASRADPQLAPQNPVAQLPEVTTALTVPGLVLHAPHTASTPLLSYSPAHHASPASYLSSAPLHSLSCFSLLPLVTGSLTAPHSPHVLHTSTRLLTHPHTTPHTVPLLTHHSCAHAALTLTASSHTPLTSPQSPRAHTIPHDFAHSSHTHPHTFRTPGHPRQPRAAPPNTKPQGCQRPEPPLPASQRLALLTCLLHRAGPI